MELQVLISKKGTKVIAASNLYQALQLPEQHYSAVIKKWINDIYEFSDDIRKPIRLQDYAKRKIANNPVLQDYYISIELAKMITLRSKSKVKQKFSKQLRILEDKTDTSSLTQEQIEAVLEITKMMTRISCQESAERKHQEIYIARNGGSAANWWKYRSQILGYSADFLRKKMEARGKNAKGKTQRQMLLFLDQAEIIRTAVIDFFMAAGKSEKHAKKLGDLSKTFAREMKMEVCDDRKGANLFASSINMAAISEMKNYRHAAAL